MVNQSDLRRGVHRIKNPDGMEDDVEVQDINGGTSMPLPESLYQERGYMPPLESLPWRDMQ